MKKILLTLVALVAFSSGVQAQGFLKGLKDKAKQKITNKVMGKANEEVAKQMNQQTENANDADDVPQLFDETPSLLDVSEADDTPVVPQATDVIPKRRTSTVVWDGTFTPSKASTASVLMAELPPLPAAEKMARSTMDERDAYNMKIAAVTARVTELQYADESCSDAELEAFRQRYEKRIHDLIGDDENALKQKMGVTSSLEAKIKKFEKMSEQEQAAYIQNHPEFIQEMQNMAAKARAFSDEANKIGEGARTMETELGQLSKRLLDREMSELNHNYEAIGAKYQAKLQAIYKQIFATNDQAKVDALYDEADKLLYDYRLEAAREYRASLQRRIANSKEYASEYTRIVNKAVATGDVPKCIVGRSDLNTVTFVANVLQEAYANLPELEAAPVEETTLYQLPKGYVFASWENRGYVEVGGSFSLSGPNGISGSFPLLASGPEGAAAVVENGKFRKITQSELDKLNRQASDRNFRKAKNLPTPPYGTYKSRSGKRVVEYSKSGELIINSMTTYCPVAFKAQTDRLEWVIINGDKIIKCLYKL